MVWAVLTINIKGGTGKSTIAEELSYELNQRGHDVGVLDADIDSSNLASRFGVEGKVTFEGDHIVDPVEKNGIKLYSMENAFEESSFNQTGEFMGEVVAEMINSSNFGDPDYLVVDCPPGSSDVFEQLVRVLRKNMLGAVSVGIPDAVEDTARLVKVCNHNWVPIITFVENMSGLYCHGKKVDCDGPGGSFDSSTKHDVEPFGAGEIKALAESVGGDFAGQVPLCAGDTQISEVADDTIASIADSVEEADPPELPEDNLRDKGFIKNVIKSVIKGIKKVNEEIPVDKVQDQFGVKDREPLVIEIEITDAGKLTSMFSELIMTVDGGDLKVMRKKKAKKKGLTPEGGMEITSQDLHSAISGEKKVMRSVNGEITTEPYSIIDAVRMGDAEIWGEKTINRLAVLDRILTEVVDMSEIQQALKED